MLTPLPLLLSGAVAGPGRQRPAVRAAGPHPHPAGRCRGPPAPRQPAHRAGRAAPAGCRPAQALLTSSIGNLSHPGSFPSIPSDSRQISRQFPTIPGNVEQFLKVPKISEHHTSLCLEVLGPASGGAGVPCCAGRGAAGGNGGVAGGLFPVTNPPKNVPKRFWGTHGLQQWKIEVS